MIKYSELAYRRSSLSLLVVFVLMSVGINLLFLVLPLFSMQVFDRVLSSESLDTLTLLLVITLFLLTVQTSLDWLRSQMMLRSAYYLEEQTRIQVTEHDLRCSASGSSISSARADLETVRETLSSPGIFSLFDAPFAPLFLLIIYIMHPTLGHFTMGGALLLMVVSVLGMKFTRQLQKSGHQHIVNFQSLGRDWMQNAESILALGMGSRIVDKWQQESVNATIDKASVKSLAIHVATFARYIRLL
ncbi:MAG: ABC transporter transmembrane domain-containing protein, partial [Endozoicomonas sp.]